MKQSDLFDQITATEEVEQKPTSQISIRPYQQQAVDLSFRSFQENKGGIIVMATGLGKTVVASYVAQHWQAQAKSFQLRPNVLFLAHREELVFQAKDKIEEVCPSLKVEVEMAEHRFSYKENPDVLVASVQSLSKRGRLADYPKDYFGLVIVDEAHHCVESAKTYEAILTWFQGSKRLGITATPTRTDSLSLGHLFESAIFKYDILQGVTEGWLVPIIQQLETVVGYDISELKTKKNDFNRTKLAEVMMQNRPLYGVCSAAIKYSNLRGDKRPTLIFAASVDHARAIADILNLHHAENGTGQAAAVSHKHTPKDLRRQILREFKEGKIRYVVNFGVLTEGFDAPEVRVVVIARPTKSELLYAQMLGRGTRPHQGIIKALNAAKSAEERKEIIRRSQKPGVLIVDIVGVSGKHKLITSTDILGGKLPPALKAHIKKKAEEQRIDVAEEIKEAQKRESEILEADAKEKRQSVLVHARLVSRRVDPFDVFQVGSKRDPGWDASKQPTQRMKQALAKIGVSLKQVDGMCHDEAKRFLEEAQERRKKGLCSYRQAKIIIKYGYSRDTTYENASKIIQSLANNNWKPFE